MELPRTKQQEWEERVQQWKNSGLTAKQYAAENGINPNTLVHWQCRLAADRRRRQRIEKGFVEVTAPLAMAIGRDPAESSPDVVGQNASCEPFEVVDRGGLRIRIPARFDPHGLRLLLATLGVR